MTVTALPLPAHPVAELMTAPAATPAPPKITYIPAPTGAPVDAPRVFSVINQVMRDVMPVSKDKENQQQRYKFRGVDDAMSAMAGPMRTHGLFILPSIAEHQAERRGEKMTHVNITMAYYVYGPAGDCLLAEVPGEASDFADKATNKAQSAALKYLLFTLFMIPVDGRSIDDGDRDHPVEPTAEHRAERRQQTQRRQQQRQQGQQQPRRSQRAEEGPWEQQAPQQAPRRDYVTEAQQASSPDQFATVRAAAEKAGAPVEYLARLDKVAADKRAAAQQTAGQQAPPPNAERAAQDAEERLRITASRANLPSLDADFERVYGLPIAQATAAQLDTFRAKIESAAGGAQ
ncbi:ERF family protein [Streptomyces sp. NPDC006333]|uniref:ERF family protein n=1 Tax=Streptomyces sp. NPDC006333 TaxID=3156753 RepID=UPI0033B9C355